MRSCIKSDQMCNKISKKKKKIPHEIVLFNIIFIEVNFYRTEFLSNIVVKRNKL